MRVRFSSFEQKDTKKILVDHRRITRTQLHLFLIAGPRPSKTFFGPCDNYYYWDSYHIGTCVCVCVCLMKFFVPYFGFIYLQLRTSVLNYYSHRNSTV